MTTTLSFEMEKTAAWRAKKAERHPSDWRNKVASERLLELAGSDEGEALAAKYDEISNTVPPERWAEVHSDVLGSIGFSFNPGNVDDVLARLIANMDESSTRAS